MNHFFETHLHEYKELKNSNSSQHQLKHKAITNEVNTQILEVFKHGIGNNLSLGVIFENLQETEKTLRTKHCYANEFLVLQSKRESVFATCTLGLLEWFRQHIIRVRMLLLASMVSSEKETELTLALLATIHTQASAKGPTLVQWQTFLEILVPSLERELLPVFVKKSEALRSALFARSSGVPAIVLFVRQFVRVLYFFAVCNFRMLVLEDALFNEVANFQRALLETVTMEQDFQSTKNLGSLLKATIRSLLGKPVGPFSNKLFRVFAALTDRLSVNSKELLVRRVEKVLSTRKREKPDFKESVKQLASLLETFSFSDINVWSDKETTLAELSAIVRKSLPTEEKLAFFDAVLVATADANPTAELTELFAFAHFFFENKVFFSLMIMVLLFRIPEQRSVDAAQIWIGKIVHACILAKQPKDLFSNLQKLRRVVKKSQIENVTTKMDLQFLTSIFPCRVFRAFFQKTLSASGKEGIFYSPVLSTFTFQMRSSGVRFVLNRCQFEAFVGSANPESPSSLIDVALNTLINTPFHPDFPSDAQTDLVSNLALLFAKEIAVKHLDGTLELQSYSLELFNREELELFIYDYIHEKGSGFDKEALVELCKEEFKCKDTTVIKEIIDQMMDIKDSLF